MTPGGQPNRPGRNGRRGPPDQFGPPGPGQPGGPPRWPHRSWDALQKSDPQMYKLLQEDADLRRQATELSFQYRRAPVERRPAIKKELTEVVNKRFDARQQRRALELKRLEEELKLLREAIERRNKARDELVAKRISQLLGEEEGLEF